VAERVGGRGPDAAGDPPDRDERKERGDRPPRELNLSLDKPIYTISVASEILETHPRTLMMYENMGLVVPQRTSTNRRRFSQRDIHKLQTIQNLTRNHGVNLNGVRYVLQLLKLLHDHGVEPPAGLRDIDVSQLDV
jgi:hypothetical protein